MNERVAEFLRAGQYEQLQEKQRLLIELGLYDKVYAPNNAYSPQYPFQEWDNTASVARWYAKVPVAVTEEEYQAILQQVNRKRVQAPKANVIAVILTVLAFLVFAGAFVAGIVNFDELEGYALLYWVVGFIVGVNFLYQAQILKLLEDIKRK